MAKPPGARAKKSRLPVLQPLTELFAETKPLCSGEQTGKQCVHYWPTVKLNARELSGKLVRQPPLRDRYCDLPGPSSRMVHLGDGGKDMMLACGRYVPSKKPYDRVFEESPLRGATTPTGPSAGAEPPTADQVTGGIMAEVMAMEQEALATGRPKVAVGGGEYQETRFQGGPRDSTIVVHGNPSLVQCWHHDDRGWLALLPVFGVAGTGATREEAEHAAAAKAEATVGPPSPHVVDGEAVARRMQEIKEGDARGGKESA